MNPRPRFLILNAPCQNCAHPLLLVTLSINIKFVTEPLICLDDPALAVPEHGPMHWPREIRNTEAVLVLHLRNGDYTMQDRPQPEAGQEAETIAHVHDGVARLRANIVPAILNGCRGDLQTPLLSEEERDTGDIRVLIVTDVGDIPGSLFRVTMEGHARV